MIYLQESNLEHRHDYIRAALDSNQVSTAGMYTEIFERQFANYLGVKDAVATNCGTSALHAALVDAGIGPGYEVIVPVLSFIAATANVVRYVGATPVFVNVDPITWCLNPIGLKRAMAIIPVHLYGVPCQLDAIKIDPIIIEDCAQSLGATYHGEHTGLWGDYGCFSFNGNKTMTAGAGGVVVTTRTKEVRHLTKICKMPDGTFDGIGFNYRMPSLCAALGLEQLKRLDGFLEKKRRFREIYLQELLGYKGITFQHPYGDSEPSWWFTCVLFDIKPDDLAVIQIGLKKAGVPTRRIFRPITDSLPYKTEEEFPVARDIWERGLCLPSSTRNGEKEIYEVCKRIRGVL